MAAATQPGATTSSAKFPISSLGAGFGNQTDIWLSSRDLSPFTLGSGGDRVLCLGGGGIRGLVQITILEAIEEAVGLPIKDCFDWIGGTSTGGILALAMMQGKPLDYCKKLYWNLKDAVFEGERPYSSEPLKKFLKEEFGEHAKMLDYKGNGNPRVVVPATLANLLPAELYLFRNYDSPWATGLEPLLPPDVAGGYVWQAAMATSAAPTYFRAFGPFLDGGLMANNPTLDLLEEIYEYNQTHKLSGVSDVPKSTTGNLRVVVSLGTGFHPAKPNSVPDIQKYNWSAWDIFHPLKDAAAVRSYFNLVDLLVNQATHTEGQPVRCAKAWCKELDADFLRFNPVLSQHIPLDCKDGETLEKMIDETEKYIKGEMEKKMKDKCIKDLLSDLLKPVA